MEYGKHKKNLAKIPRCFHLSPGLKFIFHKSRVFGIGVDIQEVIRGARTLGCESVKISFIYLGVPVGENMNLKKHWRPMIEKFQSKLTSWKAKPLSFGGRLTLTEVVLGSLPSYYFSLFVALIGIIDTLEKIITQFLWGESDEKYKTNWVAWEKVIATKYIGGLDWNHYDL